MLSLPSNVGVPLVVRLVSLVEGRAVWCVWCPRVRIGSGVLCCPTLPLRCPALHCVHCHGMLVGLCLVAGLCYCGMAVTVCVGAERRWCLVLAVNPSCVVGCGMAAV